MKPERVAVEHTCAGRDHTAEVTITRKTKLNCGCTRLTGTRCDGTQIQLLTGCRVGSHEDDLAVAR